MIFDLHLPQLNNLNISEAMSRYAFDFASVGCGINAASGADAASALALDSQFERSF